MSTLSDKTKHILIGAIISIALFATGIMIYLPFAFAGIMGTDSCYNAPSGSLDQMGIYLLVFLPCMMLIGSIIPGLLIALGKHWKWSLISSAIFAVINVCIYMGYYGLLSSACG